VTNSHMTLEMARRAMKSIAVNELVDLILPLVRSPDDSLRQARDKVRQRVQYAVKKNDPQALAAIGAENNYTLNIGQAAIWARTKWPWVVLGPGNHRPPPISEKAGVRDGVIESVIPGDIDRCKAALREAYDVIHEMQKELASLGLENSRLAPLARRYQEICVANRKSAKTLRKRRA
jgi:hypothetical protein